MFSDGATAAASRLRWQYVAAGVLASTNDREHLWQGLTGRATYATTGTQIYLDFASDGHVMGSEYQSTTPPRLTGRIAGTNRLASVEVVRLVAELDCETIILDGETLAITDDGRPRPFQDTMSGFSAAGRESDDGGVLRPYFFDCLHLDGADLIDEPLVDRLAALEAVAPGLRIPSTTVTSADEIGAVFDRVVADGHEGVMVKSPSGVYAAGRRGRSWQKIKPVHTFDLVVLAAEWGSGRRRGWLSNIHLGARDPAGGGFVMLGKTFKGMTDAMLDWQTARFTELADGPMDGYVVTLRPEQVVEIAFDGVQASTRYPGKPLVELKGADGQARSLIRRSWEAAMQVRGVDRVVVATDDDRIRTHAEAFGAEVVRLLDGSVLAVARRSGSAADQATRAARCALAFQPLLPEASIAVATGLGDASAPVPVGPVLDRAAAEIDVSPGPHLVAAKVCTSAVNDEGRVRLRFTGKTTARRAGSCSRSQIGRAHV